MFSRISGVRLGLVAVLSAITVLWLLPSGVLASARNASGAVAACTRSEIVVWLDTQANRAAGSTYYTIEFTNLSARACTLRGYPGASAVTLSGRQLGSSAGRNPAHPARLVRLAPRGTATSVLRITDGHNYAPNACRATTAAGLRVYPPNQTVARVVPFPFIACARSGPVYLHVEPVQ
jgi:Protein of unknown function (DUF4232)